MHRSLDKQTLSASCKRTKASASDPPAANAARHIRKQDAGDHGKAACAIQLRKGLGKESYVFIGLALRLRLRKEEAPRLFSFITSRVGNDI